MIQDRIRESAMQQKLQQAREAERAAALERVERSNQAYSSPSKATIEYARTKMAEFPLEASKSQNKLDMRTAYQNGL